MANIKVKALFYCVALFCSALSGTVYAQDAEVQKSDYLSENGRGIRISSTGNLIGLETPAGFGHIEGREGYVLAYDDPYSATTRVLYDVFDSQSMSIKAGLRDFVPVSFEGPPSGTTFPINALVSATAVVDTRDGLLRLTRQFTWRAGTGTVTVRTTITNLAPAPFLLRSYKHFNNIRLNNYGAYGVPGRLNPIIIDPTSRLMTVLPCAPPDCPPPPIPFSPPSPPPITFTPDAVSRHLLQMSGSPTPTRAIVSRAGDDSELRLATPGTSLYDTKTPGDYQQTLAWVINQNLAAGGSRSFTTTYQVH